MTAGTARAAAPAARGPSRAWRVDAITDYWSFQAIESTWNALVDRSGGSSPFMTHEWVSAWIESFGRRSRLFILVVTRDGEVAAIAPLMLRSGLMYGIPVRWVESIQNVYTERFDFIVPEPSEELYETIWRYLVDRGPAWDVMALRQVPASSPTSEHLPRLAARDGLMAEPWRSSHAPYLAIDGSWEDFLARLDRKHRGNLRNRQTRLGQLGAVELERVEDPGRIGAALAEGWSLEAASWKGRAGTAIQGLPRVRAFYDLLSRRTARHGWLRLYFLKVAGRRIGFAYVLLFRNRLYLLKPAYDPEYAVYSPFTILCSLILREAFEEGIQEFDFLGTDEPWKRRWTRTARPHDWIFVFRPGLRTSLLHWGKFRLAPWLRRDRT